MSARIPESCDCDSVCSRFGSPNSSRSPERLADGAATRLDRGAGEDKPPATPGILH